ncbi:MAG: polyamine aminopropyltransferase [bacterium]
MKKDCACFKKNKWFFEEELPGGKPYTKIGIRLKRKIFSGKSRYQKIEVFDSYEFGRMLVLDGLIQLTKKDEFIYHEMITHPALFSHPNPKNILIVGGGDGGALREVLKHPIREAYLVDIDKKVIETFQKYLPFVSKGAFKNKKAKVFIEDGMKFIKKYKDFFDIVIIDLTDPSGPSLPLFSLKFYRDVWRALAKDGIVVTQSGSLLLQFPQVKMISKSLRKIFSSVKIHRTCIPCFFDGEFSFTLGSKRVNLDKANFEKIKERYEKLKLKTKYYSPEIHFSSAVLPKHHRQNLKIK